MSSPVLGANSGAISKVLNSCSNASYVVDHPTWIYAAIVWIVTLNSILLNQWGLKYLKPKVTQVGWEHMVLFQKPDHEHHACYTVSMLNSQAFICNCSSMLPL